MMQLIQNLCLNIVYFYTNGNTSYSILLMISITGTDVGISAVLLWTETVPGTQRKCTCPTQRPQTSHKPTTGIEPRLYQLEVSALTTDSAGQINRYLYKIKPNVGSHFLKPSLEFSLGWKTGFVPCSYTATALKILPTYKVVTILDLLLRTSQVHEYATWHQDSLF